MNDAIKAEPVQKGNPHQLIVKQHIFPRQSLSRFAENGRVAVRYVGKQEENRVKTENPLFCAKRAWDQRSETLLSHDTEQSFAKLVDKLVAGAVTSLTEEMNEVVTDFQELCYVRYDAHLNRQPDTGFAGVSGNEDLMPDQQEILEKKGMYFIGQNGKMPGRMITGIHMMAHQMYRHRQCIKRTWGIWTAEVGEFVVPDNFMKIVCVPVSPTIWLTANSPNHSLNYKRVAQLNAFHIRRAHRYYFTRDFDVSPIYKRCVPNYELVFNPA
jgi:hypothetical protein